MDKEAVEKHLEVIVSEGFTSQGSGKFAKTAKKIAAQYLGNKLSNAAEIPDIAQDAFSAAIAKTYAINRAGSSKKLKAATSLVDVEGYVVTGIKNYCTTLRARLVKFERTDNPFDDTTTHQIEEDIPNKSVSPDSANSSSEFLSSIRNNDISFSQLDVENIIDLLREKKLGDDRIEIILRHLSGESFTEMAKESKQSPDKFRKAYNRAIEKAGIEQLKQYK